LPDSVKIHVENGVVQGDTQPDWYMKNFSGTFPEDLSQFTVQGLLNFSAQAMTEYPQAIISLCNTNPRYEVRTNAKLGYLESLRFTRCSIPIGVGLLCPQIQDCSTQIEVKSFHLDS